MQNKKKRVFHIVSHFDVGGAERVAVNIAKSQTEGFEYHVVELIRAHSAFTKVFIKELEDAGIKYHRGLVPEVHFHYLFERIAAVTFPLWFIFLFLRYRPAVIHSHTEMPDLAVYSFFKMFPTLLRGCKVVRTIHNTQLWTGLKNTGMKVEKFFIRNNSNIAISVAVRDNYTAEYHQTASIIYNGVAPSTQKPFDGIVEGKKNILFAGRLEPQKGIDVLVEIISRLSGDGRFFFHVVGDGSMHAFVQNKLGGLPNVSLRGPIHGLPAYLSSFDYLLMPSVFEGLSIMSLEASMETLPVIANSCPGLRDTLPDDWPLKVNGNSIDAYMHIFNDIVAKEDKSRLGRIARDFAAAKFGVRQMQTSYEKVYG